MKLPLTVLFFLTLLMVTQAQPLNLQKDKELITFLRSFLMKIHESRSVDGLLRCITSGEDIFGLMVKALDEMKTLDTYRLMIGVKLLFVSFQDLFKMLSACMNGFTKLKKLEEALRHPDIDKIVKKIVVNTKDIFIFIRAARYAFHYGDYKCAGENVGQIIRILVLNDVEAKEFLKGLAEAINEKEDVNKLADCVSRMSNVINDVVEGWTLILKGTMEDIISGIVYFTKAFDGIKKVIDPCSKGFTRIRQLFNAIKAAKIGKLIEILTEKPTPFIVAFADLVEAILLGDVYRAGKDVGEILFRFFLKPKSVEQLL